MFGKEEILKKDIFGNYCDQFEIDHIYPLSKGGSNWTDNKQYICRDSNREKSNKTKGHVNGKYFYIKHWGRDDFDKIIGEIFIEN